MVWTPADSGRCTVTRRSALTGHVMSLVHGELDGAASACLWKLYSGSGLFTLPLATLSAGRTRMLSVEGGKTAVKHAQRNLRAIHLGNVDARVGDVAKDACQRTQRFGQTRYRGA